MNYKIASGGRYSEAVSNRVCRRRARKVRFTKESTFQALVSLVASCLRTSAMYGVIEITSSRRSLSQFGELTLIFVDILGQVFIVEPCFILDFHARSLNVFLEFLYTVEAVRKP